MAAPNSRPKPIKPHKLRWLRLDNAAKIYPAARRSDWSNVYRLSVTLTREIDPEVLQKALDITAPRFPSFAARLRRGVFWYYLQQLEKAPPLHPEYSYPLTRMTREEVRTCAFRVILYKNRIALEVFHSLADGTGAITFLKTLVAEYLLQKYGLEIPPVDGVLDRQEAPREEELEDSFPKYAGALRASRRERDAFRLNGTPEESFHHLTCLRLPVKDVLAKAREQGVSVTAYLCAAMMAAIAQIQNRQEPDPKKRKPIKIMLPVNLRNLFPSQTLRNFALYITPELLPQLGDYTFPEICRLVYHRMGLDITPKQMSMKIATNMFFERFLAVKLIPLFLKNILMKAVFHSVGERKSCMSMSNMGAVTVPEEMKPYIERFDVVLGIQATGPYNCGVLSYGDYLNINIIRNIKEPLLESCLHKVLQEQGLPVQVQSNH